MASITRTPAAGSGEWASTRPFSRSHTLGLSVRGPIGRHPLRLHHLTRRSSGATSPAAGLFGRLVTPKTAAVYIDGYYAGTVDDFDGPFQKLYIVPGEHEVQIVAHGHRVYEQIVVIDPGRTLELEDVLEPLAPSGASGPPVHGSPGGAPPPPPAPSTGAEESGSHIVAPSFGRLLVRVQPPDAEVWIDGALWGSLAGMDAVTIHIGAGPHRLEIRRAGYQSFVSEVTIPAGATEALNVWLAK